MLQSSLPPQLGEAADTAAVAKAQENLKGRPASACHHSAPKTLPPAQYMSDVLMGKGGKADSGHRHMSALMAESSERV